MTSQWRCARQTRHPVKGPEHVTVRSDPQAWLDEQTAELLAVPGSFVKGYWSTSYEEIRSFMVKNETRALASRSSLWRVIRLGTGEIITLTVEPL